MTGDTLRGTNLGGYSLESDHGVELSDRKAVDYVCSTCGMTTRLIFATEAEEPTHWDCSHCGREARLPGRVMNESDASKTPKESKTHFEMLLERRTRDELEVILLERLTYLRERRGQGLEDLAG